MSCNADIEYESQERLFLIFNTDSNDFVGKSQKKINKMGKGKKLIDSMAKKE